MATNSGGPVSEKPPEVMKRVDLKQDTLSAKDRAYMEKMSKAHMESFQKVSRASYLRRNIFVALCLGAGTLGVCILF